MEPERIELSARERERLKVLHKVPRVVVSGWWLVVGGWWLVVGGWRLVVGDSC